MSQHTNSSQLVELVMGGLDPSAAIQQLNELQAHPTAPRATSNPSPSNSSDPDKKSDKWGWGAKLGLAGAGALATYLGGKAAYKAGELKGSIGRKAAFLKGFGLGTATGSIGTAATSLLHKGAQQAGREAALSRYVHGTAHVPSFTFQDLHQQGHYGASGSVHHGMPSPGYGHHQGAFHVPRKPVHHLPPPGPMMAHHEALGPPIVEEENWNKRLAKIVVETSLRSMAK